MVGPHGYIFAVKKADDTYVAKHASNISSSTLASNAFVYRLHRSLVSLV